jgi:hypothetical protein
MLVVALGIAAAAAVLVIVVKLEHLVNALHEQLTDLFILLIIGD